MARPWLPVAGDSVEGDHLLKICRYYLHPHWWSIWVDSNRWGERERERQNFPSAGTLWVGTFAGEARDILVVPRGSIPYARTFRDMASVEFTEDNRVIGAPPMPGWRRLLVDLTQKGAIVIEDHDFRQTVFHPRIDS